jgi:hypothetical protein
LEVQQQQQELLQPPAPALQVAVACWLPHCLLQELVPH